MNTETVNDKFFEQVVRGDKSTLDSLLMRSREIQKECEDFTVVKANNQNVRFNNFAGLTYKVSETDGVRNSSISRYALGQLGGKIGVPSRYLEKCVQSGRIDLAQENVNSWLNDYDKDLFIREYKGGIRGILSSKYSVCDAPEILEVLNDVVDSKEYRVKGHVLNAERLHIRVTQKEMLPIDGEDLFAGFTIDSSDVGRSVLNCNFFIYKQVCTNGLVVSKGGGTLFQQKHIGITADEFRNGLRESLEHIPSLITSVTESIQEKMGSGKVLKSFTDEEEIAKFMESLKNNTRLPEESVKKVIDIMSSKKYDNSSWGLINSITEVAQDFTLEKRIELEKYAGNILVA